MRLLIDENLSFRLVDILADCFPNSYHVRELGLRGASDEQVWEYAGKEGLVILTKDWDFQVRSVFRGSPPKVILLRLGNCTTSLAATTLRNSLEAIAVFEDDETAAMLLVP